MIDLLQKKMHNLIVLSFLLLLSCNTKNEPKNNHKLMQNTEELDAIKKMLKAQQDYWNNGDIDGFMKSYWNSKELIFTSLNHKSTYGWNKTLERYKESYPTKESMGKLKFKIINLELISHNTAALKGEWELIRNKDHPIGVFWLDLRKFEENWLITKDSTISLVN